MNARRVAHLLRELAAELETDEKRDLNTTVYTSTSLPPGITSREHFATECRKRGVGTKHGRIWTVPAIEWINARNAKKKTTLHVVGAPESATRMADEDIDAAGARETRKVRS